jgi:hypothetical protein
LKRIPFPTNESMMACSAAPRVAADDRPDDPRRRPAPPTP